MADTGVDIDLYGDMESEFPAEDGNQNDSLVKSEDNNDDLGDDGNAGGSDLYDDVLTLKDDKTGIKNEHVSGSSSSSTIQGKRYQLYVGNLTWWTTDADIADAVLSLGVNDFLEVKFYENRANGQSKGFCCVSLGSESSSRTVMERLPKKELHGQNPVVTYATKLALNQFEAQSKTRPTPPPSGQQGQNSGPPMGRGSGHHFKGPRGPGGSFSSGRPPLISHPPPRAGDLIRGPPPAIPPPGIPVVRLPPGVPPTSLPAPPPHLLAGPPPRMGVLPPHAHVNPAFLGGAPGYPPPSAGLSEHEFEEIMARNRTVSSSAIARAVQDAASNDFASAIETLVTAISLIKQSKVAHDDRCRILISSLQDTLHGIESKSYGARSRDRSRSRERHRMSGGRRRSYSRERDYRDHRDHRDYYRERSRSRERDYRREDKYYDDRYKHRESESRGERSSRDEMERGSSRSDPRSDKDRDRERSRH